MEENWTNVWLGVEDAPEVELIVGVSDANCLLQVATFESGYIWDDNGEEDDDHLNWVGGHISSIIVILHVKTKNLQRKAPALKDETVGVKIPEK